MNKRLLISSAIFCALGLFAENSPFASKVYEFKPAPGQFINELPETHAGITYDKVLELVAEQICGSERPGMISLGGFGGYVVFGFDHPVVNMPGEYDFKIFGNAIISDRQNNGGSSEPGIVSVSVDTNGNGLPDDDWYELAGSDHNEPGTIRQYSVTYYRPDENKTPVPDPIDKMVTDTQYIRHVDSVNNEGYITKNSTHTQSYWPIWMDECESYTLAGTKLADNYTNIGTTEEPFYIMRFLDWGYVDNKPNGEDPGFNIDNAVDSNGNPVKLEKVDFIRVHTAMNQTCGRLGESSTEICGARDLHPDASTSIAAIESDGTHETRYYNMYGQQIKHPAKGDFYIRVSASGTTKIRY